MSTVNLTAATFEESIRDNQVVLIDFWAAWCGPCRRFAPVFAAVSERYPDVVFGKVDTEVERALAGRMGITSIPMLMIFRENVLVFAESGALPAPALEELIGAALALDMDEVRAELAAPQTVS